MSTQTHTTTIKNADIIRQIETRTFKFGKAREASADDKLTSDVKLTDMQYDREMVYGWIDTAVGNVFSTFKKYATSVTNTGSGDTKQSAILFTLSSKWTSSNGVGFDSDINEYVINVVISDFLSLSMPREADLYSQKAMVALKNAERKLYYKTA